MKYKVVGTSALKRELKLIKRRHKDLEKLRKVVNILSSGEVLEEKYRDHSRINNIVIN